MCGIFGVAGPGIIGQDIKILKDIGIISQLRGLDSAGVFQTRTVGADKNTKHLTDLYKSTGSWVELLNDIDWNKKWYPNLLSSPMVDLIMCHVRSATRGAITKNNAHPFETDRFIGVHNGTLHDYKYQHVSKTDSQMMFEDMDRRGIYTVLDNLLSTSAYAVAIYERSTRSMIFSRNDKRPLWFVYLKNRAVMYWASEPSFITLALSREHVEYDKPEPFPVGVIARMVPSKIKIGKHLAPWTQIGELKEKEEIVKDLAKDLELAPSISSVFVNRANNSTAIMPEHQPKQEQKLQSETVIKREDTLADFRLNCKCGKRQLDVFKSNLCKRHTPGMPKYDSSSNTFECVDACKAA